MSGKADKITGRHFPYDSLKEDSQCNTPQFKQNLIKKKEHKYPKDLMRKFFKTNSLKQGTSLELSDVSPSTSYQTKIRTSSLSETQNFNASRSGTHQSILGCQSTGNDLDKSDSSSQPCQEISHNTGNAGAAIRKHSLKCYSLNSGMTDRHLIPTDDVTLVKFNVPGVSQEASSSPKQNKYRTLPLGNDGISLSQDIDVATTKLYLDSLNEHIKNKREKLVQLKTDKTNRTDDLLNQMQVHSEDTSPDIKRHFEECNRQTNKIVRELQSDLDSLLYRKQVLETSGIPYGVNAKEYVKNLSSRKESTASKKRSGMFENMKQGFDDMMGGMKDAAGSIKKSLKSTSKSASMENISGQDQSTKENNKSPSHTSSSNKSHRNGSSKEKRPASIEDGRVVINKTNHINCTHVPTTANKESDAKQTRSLTARSSISSSIGDPLTGANHVSLAAKKNLDLESPTQEEVQQSDLQNAVTVREDISMIRKELSECREENLILKGALESLSREMRTHADIHRHRMQNSAEKIDRLDKLVEDCNQQMYREFASCREELRHLDEKFSYKLTTTTRDLRDSIDSLNNSLNLFEKRVEQFSYGGFDSQKRKDPRLIYNNFMNVGVSVVAFLMVILSGCFHFLIRAINFGAVLVQHKLKLIFIILPLIVSTAILYPYRSDIIDTINSYHLPLTIKETLKSFK